MSAGQSLDRGRAALLALAVAVALAAGGAAAQTPTTLLGISIPDRVAGLSHLAPTDFEKDSPGMGYGIRFPSSDWTIDVYIYDLRMKSIPDDPNSAAVQSALSEAKDEIAEIAKRGDYQNVGLKDTLNIADAAGHARFVCAEYNYFHKRRGVDLDSYLCLAGVRGEFFQIRMDTAKNTAAANDARGFVKAWIGAWMPVLWPSH